MQATGNVTEAEKKEAGEDGKSEEKAAEEQKVKSEETAENAGEVKSRKRKILSVILQCLRLDRLLL